MCPDQEYDIVKDAIFGDVAGPDNLQPGNPFRKVYPTAKGKPLNTWLTIEDVSIFVIFSKL